MYLSIVTWYAGVPTSLSESYYRLGQFGWLFPLCMCLVSASLFPVWIENANGIEFLPFLACCNLIFVAFTPAYRMDLQEVIHYTAAVMSGFSAVLWQVLAGLWDITLLFAFVGGMFVLMDKKRYMFTLECSIIGSLYCNLLRLVWT